MKPSPRQIRWVLPQGWSTPLLVALALWLLALVATQAPLFFAAPEPSDSDYRLALEISAIVWVATFLLGFAIGWTRGAGSIVPCALYGSFVLTTTQFLLTHWVPQGGEPLLPMPINFLIAIVVKGISLGLLLGLGALAAAGTRWASRRSSAGSAKRTGVATNGGGGAR